MNASAPGELIGAGPFELLAFMALKFEEIETFTLFEYDVVPLLQERSRLNKVEARIVEDALKLREHLTIPFWDAAMLSCFSKGEQFPNLLQAALYHQPPARTQSVHSKEIQSDFVCQLRAEVSARGVLAVSSEVKCSGGQRAHIPLLDFHCPQSAQNLVLVIQVAEKLFPRGFAVLKSGKSFHVYGLTLHSQQDFDASLTKALFFAPIIDRAYIAHQLLERRAGLRVTRAGEKPEPVVVHVHMP
jgi:hypothetical protein